MSSKKKGSKSRIEEEEEVVPPGVTFEYDRGERVLAYSLGLPYEAKVLKRSAKPKDGEYVIKYRVHYQKWSKRYDEWLGSEEIMPLTDENLQLAKEMFREAKQAEREKKEAKANKGSIKRKAVAEVTTTLSIPNDGRAEKVEESVSTTATKATKVKRVKTEQSSKAGGRPATSASSNAARQKEGPNSQSAALSKAAPKWSYTPSLSRPLQQLLVSDAQRIQAKMLVRLPRKPSAKDIIKQLAEEHSNETDTVVLAELVQAFCLALAAALLYPFERTQYFELLQDEGKQVTDLADIYGAEHLLRFIVRFPELCKQASQPESSALVSHIKLLLAYMESHYTDVFNADYDYAAPRYLRMGPFAGL